LYLPSLVNSSVAQLRIVPIDRFTGAIEASDSLVFSVQR